MFSIVEKYFCKYVESIKYLLNFALLFFDGGGDRNKRNQNNNVHRNLCGRKVAVQSLYICKLDLLKFYLAILKWFRWCRFCAGQRRREVNSREGEEGRGAR